MKLGYNTNGFAHHRLPDALTILAALGYESVALTLDHHHLDPFAAGWERQAEEIGQLLAELKLGCVVETGARFLLDPWNKHEPTLLSSVETDRRRRIDFIVRASEIAARLNAATETDGLVSLWSGKVSSESDTGSSLARLQEGLHEILDRTAALGTRLAFEPEPGMFIATVADFAELHAQVRSPRLGLTIDLGHLFCQREEPIAAVLQEWRPWLWNIHIEDMRRDVHDHLLFGEGDMDFPPLAQALRQIGYQGGIHVELSRHSHNAVAVAGASRAFLLAAGFGPRLAGEAGL